MFGDGNPFYGKKHTEETKKRISMVKTGKNLGENHPGWKGGKPDCIDCGNKLSMYGHKRCVSCRGKFYSGENNSWFGKHHTNKSRKAMSASLIGLRAGNKHPMWKGGISTTREYKNFYGRRDKYRRKNAVGSHTLEEWQALKSYYGYMCLCCKRIEPEIKLTEDHIVPLSRGGTNSITNIQPLCHSCNSRKSVKNISYLPEEDLQNLYSKIMVV